MVNVYVSLTGLCCPLFRIVTPFSSPFLRVTHLEPKSTLPCQGALFLDLQWYTPLLKSYQMCTVSFFETILAKYYLQYDCPLLRTKYNTELLITTCHRIQNKFKMLTSNNPIIILKKIQRFIHTYKFK